MSEEIDLPWVPPGMNEEQLGAFLAFSDGLPSGMAPLVIKWIKDIVLDPRTRSSIYPEYRSAVFTGFQLQMNKDYGWPAIDRYSSGQVGDCFRGLDATHLVYFVDYVLAQDIHDEWMEDKLDDILEKGRSNWTVGERMGRPGLVSRIPSAVADAVEMATSNPSKANDLLRRAWAQAYGVTPDPAAAYSSAVKAVEVYSTKIFNPKTNVSTLGKDIAAFRAKPEKWDFHLGNHDAGNRQHLLGMMSLLWNSQSDRHGSEDYKDVTVEQARAAVLLANTLVGWFDQELVKLKE